MGWLVFAALCGVAGCTDITQRGREGADFSFDLNVRCAGAADVECEVNYRARRAQETQKEGQSKEVDPSKIPLPR